jgi:hypothetical protein
MPSVRIGPIHATASPPPRYPKEEPEPPPTPGGGSEKGGAVLLNRMRAAVVTHYRTSPSTPHRPIDLTHVHEEPFVSLMTNGSAKNDQGGGSVTQQEATEEEEEEDYVPPSLADYVAYVSRALEEQQMEFLNSTSHSEARDEQNDPDTMLQPSKSFQANDTLSHHRRSSSDGLAQLWSPESCFRSPPPLNPAALLTDTQLQKQALSSSSSFSHGDPPLLRSLPPFSLTSVKRKVEVPPAASPPRHLNVEVIVEPMETGFSNATTIPASPDQRSSAGQEVVIRDEEAAASVLGDSYNADSDALPEQKDLMHLLSTIATDHDQIGTAAVDALRISTTIEEEDAIPARATTRNTRTVDPSPIAALLTRTSNAPAARTKAALRTNPSDEDTDSRHLMAGSSLSTDTNKIPSPPKRMFTNRPPTSPKSLAIPSPRYSDVKRTPPSSAAASYDRRRAPPTPISTQEPPKPLITTVSTPSPLSMSSANQKAFGGRGGAFQPSISSSSTISSIPTSPVPRFHSPPTSPRVKKAPRFTAETADRLSRPNKTPPPHYTSPLKKNMNHQPIRASTRSANSKNPLVSPQPPALTPSVVNRTTIASMRRRSESPALVEESEPIISSSHKAKQPNNHRTPAPPPLSRGAIDTHVTDTTPTRRRSMERLVRHSKVLKNGRMSPFSGPPVVATAPVEHPSVPKIEAPVEHQSVTKIETGSPMMRDSPVSSYKLSKGFELSLRLSPSHKSAPSPPPVQSEKDVIERLSRPTVARMTAIECTLNPPPPREEEEELNSRPPSPYVFTAETADRLNQPTAARSSAIHATVASSLPQHRRNNSGSVCGGGSVSSRDGGYESSGERHLPPPLDPSSHLLHNTAVSDAKKTTPKKVIARLPPPKKYVSGASDRLMTRTVANRALVAGRKVADPKEKPIRKPTTTEKPKFTVEDGIAKAKERVRLRQLQKKQEEQRKGLPPMHPPVHTPNNAAHRPVVAKRPLTVPCGPRVASMRLAKDRQSKTDDPSLAQRLDIFDKGLRDDFSVGSQGSSFSRRSLTIPTGPTLATDIRGGEKYIPPKSRSDVSLAQSTDLLQHGLRSPYHSTNSHRGLTIPVSPKFVAVPPRQRPKSTAELEAAEMEYFNSHRFKAKPPLGQRHSIGSARSSNGHVPGFMKPTAVSKLSQRLDRSVVVEPRKAASVASRSHSSSTQRSREMDPIVERADRLAKALALREEARQQKLALEEAERQEQARFKAKPVPRTTYQYTPVVPAPSGPLVEPFSPELQTKQRVIERRKFDLQAEQERAMRLAEMQAMEARLCAEEEEDLQERRRLPVSEGGLIPVAAPINAVLLQ